MAPRVLRLVLGSVAVSKEYFIHFEKELDVERCYIVYWEEQHLKKICIDCQSLDQAVPDAELIPLARFFCSMGVPQLPMCIRGCSSSLLRVVSDNRSDSRQFVVICEFGEETFLQCVRRGYESIFGMVEVTTIVEYVVQRLRSALYEVWTEGKPLLRKCIRQGSVRFANMLELLTDLIDLWPTIRSFVRSTGFLEAKEKADSVSGVA